MAISNLATPGNWKNFVAFKESMIYKAEGPDQAGKQSAMDNTHGHPPTNPVGVANTVGRPSEKGFMGSIKWGKIIVAGLIIGGVVWLYGR